MSNYKIGIEYEFRTESQDRTLRKLTSQLNVELNQYFPIGKDTDITVALDSEYYQNQYEVKFAPFEPTHKNITAVQSWIEDMHEKLPIQNNGPAFVGTHVHIFRPFPDQNPGYFKAVEETFKEMHEFVKEFAQSKYIHKDIKKNELLRLLTSNNLLKFFDFNYLGNTFKKIQMLSSRMPQYQYLHIGNDKPKYKPCLWSPQRQGKQKTFEIRYIPNSYFLLKSPQDIASFIDRINTILLNAQEPTEEEITTSLTNITKYYYDISQIFKRVSENNRGVWNPETEPLEPFPYEWMPIHKDHLLALQNVDMNRISDDQLRSTAIQWISQGDDDEDSDDGDYDDDDGDNDYDEDDSEYSDDE